MVRMQPEPGPTRSLKLEMNVTTRCKERLLGFGEPTFPIEPGASDSFLALPLAAPKTLNKSLPRDLPLCGWKTNSCLRVPDTLCMGLRTWAYLPLSDFFFLLLLLGTFGSPTLTFTIPSSPLACFGPLGGHKIPSFPFFSFRMPLALSPFDVPLEGMGGFSDKIAPSKPSLISGCFFFLILGVDWSSGNFRFKPFLLLSWVASTGRGLGVTDHWELGQISYGES